MKFLISFTKFFTYSNLLVSSCVAAYTHLTYILYDLPKENQAIVLGLTFCFTYFTYNIQRLIKFRDKFSNKEDLGSRLKWVLQHIKLITISSFVFGFIGLICTYYINPSCWYLLVPMGILTLLYVFPILPFYRKSPTLRQIPYLKIFIIALVWSIVIVGLPYYDASSSFNSYSFPLLMDLTYYASPVFFFTIGITIPFDIRDIPYDNEDNLKTIPNTFGIRSSILIAEAFLIISILLFYLLLDNRAIFNGLIIGHAITMVMIWFSGKKNRKELFYSGLIESSVLVLYSCVLIADYLSSL